MLARVGYDWSMAEEKNPAALALGKLGASKGGKARAEKLTKEQRVEIARKAAKARWAKKQQQ
jgi:ABC-type phosphate/phosphonate transport system ATPase subunit